MATSLQPFPSRAIVSEDLEGLRISVPPKREYGSLLFLTFWLCGWTVGGFFALRALFHHFNLFISVWMVGWVLGEASAGYQILYALGGREIITTGIEALNCRKQIFGIGRTKSYLVREMSDLRFLPEGSAGRNRLPARLAFNYGGKTVTFAAGVNSTEAVELIARIRQRCAIPSTSAPQESGIKFWQGH